MSKLMWGRAPDSTKDAEKKDSSVSVESRPGPRKDVAQRLEDLDSRLEQLAEMQAKMQDRLRPLDSLAEMAKGNGSQEKLGDIEAAISGLTERLQNITTRIDSSDPSDGPLELPEDATDGEKFKHLNALIRLAESKVIDADKMAETMLSEAEERAKAEEERLMAEARQRVEAEEERLAAEARQKAEQILEETTGKAQQEAERIRREAEGFLLKSKQLLEGEIQGLFDQAHEKLQSIQKGETE